MQKQLIFIELAEVHVLKVKIVEEIGIPEILAHKLPQIDAGLVQTAATRNWRAQRGVMVGQGRSIQMDMVGYN